MKKPGEFRVVNHSVPRADGRAKVTGRATYTSDLVLENMAWAKVLRSPFGHALILSIDVSQAKAHPGVIDVITGADLQGIDPYYGHAVKDHPILAIERVRFVGEPIAAVVAETELAAEEALELIEVDYHELTAVIGVDEALAPDAPLIHERDYREGAFRGFKDGRQATGNVCQYVHVKWGNAAEAMAGAAHIVEGEFQFPMAYAYAMEPYVAIAHHTGNNLTVYSSAQHPFMVRSDLAEIFHLPLNAVRMIVPFVGGGYGSKSYTKVEPIPAVCSLKTGRPVKLQLSVEEAFLTTRGDDARVRIRTACDANGKLLAREATIHLNTGAYAENSPLVCAKAANRIIGPYLIPNVDIHCYAVYTNTVPASSYRGFGSTQVTFPAESQLEELADKVGSDPVEFRLSNLAERGQTIYPGLRPIDADVPGDLRKARELFGPPPRPGFGRAVGCSASDAGSHPVTSALIHVYSDNSVSVVTGSTEIGQGSHTILAQIAAEEMGVPFDKVRLVGSDTAITSFERSTGASRTTTLMGRAVLEACREAISQLKTMAADAYGCSPSDLTETTGGLLRAGHDQPVTWGDILIKYFHHRDTSIVGRAYLRQTGDLKLLPPFWEIGVAGVEVEVDKETGKVRLDKLVTVGDVGLAINPAAAEGQDLGAATMGIGIGLYEELLYDGQQLTNGTLLEYRVPRFGDLARELHLELAQNQDGAGPYGAKGGGEGSLNPIPASLANAVYRATGARIRQLPLTPERVWRALKNHSESV